VAVVYVLWRIHLQGARRTAVGIAVGAAIAVAGAALFAVDPHFAAPAQLWLAVPYVLALLALAGLVGRVRMPSALAQPYLRGGAEA
jgi:simple sugar transport system permease protein